MSKLAERKKWAHLTQAFRAALAKVDIDVAAAEAAAEPAEQQQQAAANGAAASGAAGAAAGEKPSKKRRSGSGAVLVPALKAEWRQFAGDLSVAERAAAVAEGGFAFAFVEGQLVRAVREGSWLLLDEINLAPPEVRRSGAMAWRGSVVAAAGSALLQRSGWYWMVLNHAAFAM